MDDCAALMARAAQCRRLALGLLDEAAIAAMEELARDFEDRAAVAATVHTTGRYVVYRTPPGWTVTSGGDRLVARAILGDAIVEARRMASFEDAAE